ncbi:hypothetical protein KAR91_73685 [Candidatus Pacearchaeota archaeon]|nr:hypothetical protein [Candidatus Pacearchaeota archaeon]
MTQATVNDQFTLDRAYDSLELAKAAEALLKHAREKFDEIESRKDTYMDTPDLQVACEQATDLVDDFKNAIANYEREQVA